MYISISLSYQDKGIHVNVAQQLSQIMSEKLTPCHHLKDINQLITPKDKALFIKKLFNNDNETYFNLINQLNNTLSWNEASECIENEFYDLNIDSYKKKLFYLQIPYTRATSRRDNQPTMIIREIC